VSEGERGEGEGEKKRTLVKTIEKESEELLRIMLFVSILQRTIIKRTSAP